MSIKITKKDIIWNYVGVFFSFGSNLLITPLIMYFLNDDMLGLWYVFLSIGNIITLFDFGFSSTLSRNVAYVWSGASELKKESGVTAKNDKPNWYLLNKVIKTCKIVYLAVSVIAIIIMMTVGSFYIKYISRDIAGYAHFVAWFIYCIAAYLNLFYGYYTTFLKGVGNVQGQNKARIIGRVFQIVISLVLLSMGFGIVGVSLAFLFDGLLYRGICKVFFFKFRNIGQTLKEKNIACSFEEVKELFYIVWHNAWRDGVVQISNYLATQAMTIITSLFLSLSQTGIYSISLQLLTTIASVASAMFNAELPELQSLFISNEEKKTKYLVSKVMFVYFFLFWIGVIAFVIVGIPVLKLIKPSYEFSIPFIFAMAFYQFMLQRRSNYACFIAARNEIPYMTSFAISSMVAVIMAYLGMKYWSGDMWYLVGIQCLIQGVFNFWYWPRRVRKMIKINQVELICIGAREVINDLKKK